MCFFSLYQSKADESGHERPATPNQSQIQTLQLHLQQVTSEHQRAQTQLCLAQEREREASEKVQRSVQTCPLVLSFKLLYIG